MPQQRDPLFGYWHRSRIRADLAVRVKGRFGPEAPDGFFCCGDGAQAGEKKSGAASGFEAAPFSFPL